MWCLCGCLWRYISSVVVMVVVMLLTEVTRGVCVVVKLVVLVW